MHRALEPDVAAVRAAQSQVRSADILVAAVGQPQLVRGSWIKPGAFIIDVGINSIKGTRNTHVAGTHSTPARPAPSRAAVFSSASRRRVEKVGHGAGRRCRL